MNPKDNNYVPRKKKKKPEQVPVEQMKPEKKEKKKKDKKQNDAPKYGDRTIDFYMEMQGYNHIHDGDALRDDEEPKDEQKPVFDEKFYNENREYCEEQKRIIRKEVETEMIKLVARRELLTHKLDRLDPSKRRDNDKIINYRIAISAINERLDDLQDLTGINPEEVCPTVELTGWQKFKNNVKETAHKVGKKIKKFFKKNMDAIVGIGSVVVPVIGAIITAIFVK